jgi:hypothetical protein
MLYVGYILLNKTIHAGVSTRGYGPDQIAKASAKGERLSATYLI